MNIKENKIEKKPRKDFLNSESAAATVIAAVLLLSLVFTIFAFVNVAYIPEWKNDAEKLHMSEVQKDMIELKYMADIATSFMPLDPNYSSHPFSVTIPLSMGGGEIPILEPSKSSGTLSINREPCNITIILNNSSILNETHKCGGITYFSNNEQYVDQTYRYENGAVIISQGDRSLMRHPPFFRIEENKNSLNSYNFSIKAVNISGGPKSTSSNSDLSLRIEGLNFTSVYDSYDTGDITSFNCTIQTEYPEAWRCYLNETAEGAGLEFEKDYSLRINNSSLPNEVYFEFPKENSIKKIDRLNISQSFIHAELE